jgi:hypothetical protein
MAERRQHAPSPAGTSGTPLVGGQGSEALSLRDELEPLGL